MESIATRCVACVSQDKLEILVQPLGALSSAPALLPVQHNCKVSDDIVLPSRYDAARHALVVDLEGRNFALHPALVRRNDTSAASINEWTGEKLSKSDNVPDDIEPDTVAPLGNYAVQILWQDGFNQVDSGAVYGQVLWHFL